MKYLLLVGILFSLYSCTGSSSNSTVSPELYQSAKFTIEDKERQNPLEFLVAHGTYRQNLIGEWIVEGQIQNIATSITYKDVHLRFHFYTNTGTEIGTVDRTVIKFFGPSREEHYKFKLDGPSGSASLTHELIEATPTN
jgi:hypothetical protein